MSNLDNDFEALLGAYRDALPEPEPSRHFMPNLWRKIEARRSFVWRLKRTAQLSVAGAAAACLLMAATLALPVFQGRALHSSYVDVLAESQPDENLAALGIVRENPAEPNNK
jgi:hypothetical protein